MCRLRLLVFALVFCSHIAFSDSSKNLHEFDVDRNSFTRIERIRNVQVVYFKSNQTETHGTQRCAIAWTRIKSNSGSGTILALSDEFEIFSMRLLKFFEYTFKLTNNISLDIHDDDDDDQPCQVKSDLVKLLLNVTRTDLISSTLCVIDRRYKYYQCLKCCSNGDKLIWEDKNFHSDSSNRFFSLYYLICLTTGMHLMRLFLQLFYSNVSPTIIR